MLARELAAPLPIATLIVMVVNDRYGKPHFHNFWTGKISDVAGLFLAPLLLTSIAGGLESLCCRICNGRWSDPSPTKIRMFLACLLVGLGYTAVNTLAVADTLYEQYILSWMPKGYLPPRELHVRDLEDLVALPALIAAYFWGSRFAKLPN